MASIGQREAEEDTGQKEVVIDLTDPNSVAENLESLSEEQVEELLQKALDINKKLKGCLPKEEKRKTKPGQRDAANANESDCLTSRTILPPIRKATSLVGKNEVMKDLGQLYGERKSRVKMNSHSQR